MRQPPALSQQTAELFLSHLVPGSESPRADRRETRAEPAAWKSALLRVVPRQGRCHVTITIPAATDLNRYRYPSPALSTLIDTVTQGRCDVSSPRG